MIALFGGQGGNIPSRPVHPLNRISKKHPGKSWEMPGCPLGWSADDGHQAPVPTRSQDFFRENREVARRREDFRRYSGVFRDLKNRGKRQFFSNQAEFRRKKTGIPGISPIRESAESPA